MAHVSALRVFSTRVQRLDVQWQVAYGYLINAHHFSLCTSLAKASEGLCSVLSPSVVQWDAMTVLMECTVASILKSLEEEVRGGKQMRKKSVWGCLFTFSVSLNYSSCP